MRIGKWGVLSVAAAIGVSLLLPTKPVSAEETDVLVKSDAETVAELRLLLGDGNGVNPTYLGKKSTRLQAAIISLRLQGQLDEAEAYTGTENFADAEQVAAVNQPILAYLRNHPQFGWTGTGNNRFDPLAEISSQQLYKVLLETMGYRSDETFAYADTELFAAGKGLVQIAGSNSITNADIATALVEALSANTADGGTLFAALRSGGVLTADAAMPQSKRISLSRDSKLGTYLTGQDGRALYVFAKDAEDLEACQANCLANWPVVSADELQIPASLNTADFSAFVRADGTKQLTYKGWPLYSFVKDTAAGDVKGEGVNGVWFAATPETAAMPGSGTTAAEQAKTYQVDIKEFSFGTGPLTVEAGAQIVFTNYDDMQHNAVAVDGSFATPLLAKGESYTITLEKPGTYDYFCEPHKSFMTGQIIVN